MRQCRVVGVVATAERFLESRAVTVTWHATCLLTCCLQDLCKPERQVVAWFNCQPNKFLPSSFPVFIIGKSTQETCYYGFPQHGDQPGDTCTACPSKGNKPAANGLSL